MRGSWKTFFLEHSRSCKLQICFSFCSKTPIIPVSSFSRLLNHSPKRGRFDERTKIGKHLALAPFLDKKKRSTDSVEIFDLKTAKNGFPAVTIVACYQLHETVISAACEAVAAIVKRRRPREDNFGGLVVAITPVEARVGAPLTDTEG